MTRFLVRLAALAFATALPLAAPAQEALKLTSQVFQEIEVVEKGKKQKKTVPATKIVPGSEVTYVITYRNEGAQPAEKVVITNPVPPELAYKGGSASTKGARFEVSVDGGATYGALPSLRVTGADGQPRPAQPGDVTHLRWVLAGAVPPGRQGSVSYKAVLK